MVSDTTLPSLLIVDDDPLIVDALGFFLKQDFSIHTAACRQEAISLLRQGGFTPELALVDLGLPPFPHRPDEGFALISDLLAHAPSIRIVVLSGQNDKLDARHARALGATEFVSKPADPEDLRTLLHKVLAFRQKPEITSTEVASPLLGNSMPVQKMRAQLGQFASSPFPVLIEGESGSGKELAASALHQLSNARASCPFFALNCAAIAPTLIEATLFGYAKGAFTGANLAKSGYFEDAEDGTLFLDEIGELPLELQPKLLRVLENGEFQRVGETASRHARARIVAATNRDLRREVREGRFRADLYHRLSVFTLQVPPLREMSSDRLLLLDHFRALYAAQAGQAPFELTEQAKQIWLKYNFPGNVRELRNITIRLTTKFPGQSVSPEELLSEFDAYDLQETDTLLPLVDTAMQELAKNDNFNLEYFLQTTERAYIDAAQRLSHGNVSQAARILGINRTTLYNRIEVLTRNKADRGE